MTVCDLHVATVESCGHANRFTVVSLSCLVFPRNTLTVQFKHTDISETGGADLSASSKAAAFKQPVNPKIDIKIDIDIDIDIPTVEESGVREIPTAKKSNKNDVRVS